MEDKTYMKAEQLGTNVTFLEQKWSEFFEKNQRDDNHVISLHLDFLYDEYNILKTTFLVCEVDTKRCLMSSYIGMNGTSQLEDMTEKEFESIVNQMVKPIFEGYKYDKCDKMSGKITVKTDDIE